MTNGGTGPLKGSLLLSTSGRGLLPPSLALVNTQPPYNATVLLDNFYGRQFNSLNDVKVHPGSGKIFVVDVGCAQYIHSILSLAVLISICIIMGRLATDMQIISVRSHSCPIKSTALIRIRVRFALLPMGSTDVMVWHSLGTARLLMC